MKENNLEIIFNNGDSRQILILPEIPLKIIFLFAEKELILREKYDERGGMYVISHQKGFSETDINYSAEEELKTVSEDKSDGNQTHSNLDNDINVTLDFFEESSQLSVKTQLIDNSERFSNFIKYSNDLEVINNADSPSVKVRMSDDDDDDNDTDLDFGLSCSEIADDEAVWMMSTLNKDCSVTSVTENEFNEDCVKNKTVNAFNTNCPKRKEYRRCAICLNGKTREKRYFKFPRDFERSNKWAKISGRKWVLKATPTERRKYFVCSDHFTSRDFSGQPRSRLNYNAVPSQNLPNILETSEAEQQNAETFGRLKTKFQLALQKPDTPEKDSKKTQRRYLAPVDINCCVPNCTSSKSKCPEYNFHNFPSKNSMFGVKFQGTNIAINLRQEWIRILKIETPVTYEMRVCSRHFRESDFIPESLLFHNPQLKKNVIPTQYLPSALDGDINLGTENTVESENKEKVKMDIISNLIAMGNERPVSERKLSSPICLKNHKPHVPDEKRFKNAEHMPIKCKPRRCAFCSTKKRPHKTRYMCETCNVGLCMYQKDQICFEQFHKK